MASKSDRAYTYVDAGTARLGNRWFERSWSAFLGQTVELQFPPGEIDWLRGGSPEFRLLIDGRTYSCMELGSIEWSEECDSFGATLVTTYIGESIELVSRATAFHFQPGMLRRWLVTQRGGVPMQLEEAHLDLLPIRRDNVAVESTAGVTTLRTFGRSILFSSFPQAGADVAPIVADLLGAFVAPNAPLPRGVWQSLSETYLLCVAGGSGEALQREWPQFQEHLRQYRQAEEESLRLRGNLDAESGE